MNINKFTEITNEHFGIVPISNLELEHIKKRDDMHPVISDCIIEMITSSNLPYYGEFVQFVNFWEAKIGTAGVNVTKNGMNFYWDREFFDKLNRKQIIFIIIHEVFHLIFNHQKRSVGYDHKISNLAQDMIINSLIHGDLMVAEGLSNKIETPKDYKGRNSGVFIPKEYGGLWLYEDVYAWLIKQYNKWCNENSDKVRRKKDITIDKDGNINMDGKVYCGDCKQEIKPDESGDGDGGQEETDSDKSNTCPKCGQEIPNKSSNGNNPGGEIPSGGNGEKQDSDRGYGPNGKSGDDGKNDIDMFPLDTWFEDIENNKGMSLDVHFEDDVPEAARKQMVDSVLDKLKSRGLCTNNVEKMLNKLRKTKKDYLKEIKRNLANNIFGTNKTKSITRPNRKSIWGLKGARKYKTCINGILDTSGSMGGSFERVLNYIYQNDICINLIQCDTEVKDFVKINNKKEMSKMTIKGLGGTELTPGLQYIANHKELNKYPTVLLTDGYTDNLNFSGLKKNVLILSTGMKCPEVSGSNTHGIKIKQIIIDEEK